MFLVILGCLFFACDRDEPETKTITMTEEELNQLVEERARVNPATPSIRPAAGEHPEEPRRLKKAEFYTAPIFPEPTFDILRRLGVEVQNEFAGTHMICDFGVTEAAIRGVADEVYGWLETADPMLTGWTLIVRAGQAGTFAETAFDTNAHMVVLSIDPQVAPWIMAHEMVHVLSGRINYENWLSGYAQEFTAVTAETVRPPWFDPMFDYDRANRSILGFGKTYSGERGKVHAQNTPLDGMRYDLMRLVGDKIGKQEQRRLSKKIITMALEREARLADVEIQEIFAEAGIGDCVLFSNTQEPGVYLDVVVRTDGVPLILYKQIDDQGVESSFASPMRLVWLRQDIPIMVAETTTNPGSGVLLDDAARFLAPFADEYRIVLGTTTYSYRIE